MRIEDFKVASERWLAYSKEQRTALRKQFWDYLYACEMKTEEPEIFGRLTKAEANRFEECFRYWVKIRELERSIDNSF